MPRPILFAWRFLYCCVFFCFPRTFTLLRLRSCHLVQLPFLSYYSILYLSTMHPMSQAHCSSHPSLENNFGFSYLGAFSFCLPSALNALLLCLVTPALHLGVQMLSSVRQIFTSFCELLGFCIHASSADLTILC